MEGMNVLTQALSTFSILGKFLAFAGPHDRSGIENGETLVWLLSENYIIGKLLISVFYWGNIVPTPPLYKGGSHLQKISERGGLREFFVERGRLI